MFLFDRLTSLVWTMTELDNRFTWLIRVPVCVNIWVCKVKVIAELSIKSLSWAYLISPRSNLAHTLLTECLWSKNVQWHLMKLVGLDHIWPCSTLIFRASILSIYQFVADTSHEQSYVVTLDTFSRSNVNIIAELYEKQFHSLCSNRAQLVHPHGAFDQKECSSIEWYL